MAPRPVDPFRQLLESWRASLSQIIASGNAHRCLQPMVKAIDKRDAELWKTAWEV